MKLNLTALMLVFAFLMQVNCQSTFSPAGFQAARGGLGGREGQVNVARLSIQKSNLIRLIARKNRLMDQLVNVNDQIDAIIFQL